MTKLKLTIGNIEVEPLIETLHYNPNNRSYITDFTTTPDSDLVVEGYQQLHLGLVIGGEKAKQLIKEINKSISHGG